MVFRSIFFSLLIAFFNLAVTNTVDNVKTWISPIHAEAEQEALEETEDITEESSSISLNHVLVNNGRVELDEQKRVFVARDDAVRVSGTSNPEASITVYFADREKTVSANEFGHWFVLFSITNMEEKQYVLTAKETDSEEESTHLVTLAVGIGEEISAPELDIRYSKVTEFFESLPVYTLPLILIPLAIGFGWVLGTVSRKKINKKENV